MRNDRPNYTDELARVLVRRERTPVKMTGSTTDGGVDTDVSIWTLPEALGDPGDALEVIVNGDGDLVPSWVPPFARTVSSSDVVQPYERLLLVDTSGGAVTLTLPLSADAGGPITMKKTTSDGNAATLARSGSDTIDGGTAYAVTAQYGAVTVLPDRVSAWWIVGEVA